jgi:phytoene dehydrogenase-like protein
VPDEYAPMMLEEMELGGEDVRGLRWTREPAAEVKQRFHVLVIGAGMSGILAAIRLGEAGIPYTVVEKDDAVGGTWHENRYPGCRVDVPNHFYCYSFEPNPDWSEHFAQRTELQAYFERCADKYGVLPHVRFETEVVSASWDEAGARWRATLRTPPPPGAAFVETPALRAAAVALTWATLALEGAVALAFLAPVRRVPAWLRDGTLLAFCAGTYAIAPVAGFGWLLIAMGVAQTTPAQVRTRGLYLAAFALLVAYREVPWLEGVAAWARGS